MKPTIMIVDDEPEICEAAKHYLDRKGYKVFTVNSGEEAIAQLFLTKPLLILLDIRLPGMDGLECLRRIKELNSKVLVVMVSCVTDLDVAREALKSGAVDYITKPCSLEVIERAITVYLLLNCDRSVLENTFKNPWEAFYNVKEGLSSAKHIEWPHH
ncbi:MAG: response regulator [Candidatus Omnitrophota bacterium]|nr:response regulator [Candidatus Omnitrophota bacterium]